MELNRQAVHTGIWGLLLALASFAGAAETSLYQPYPPDCRTWDDCQPKPKPWEDCLRTSYPGKPCKPYVIYGSLEEKGQGVSKSLENQDFGKASDALTEFFDGGAGQAKGSVLGNTPTESAESADLRDSVKAPDFNVVPKTPGKKRGVPAPEFLATNCGDSSGCKSEIGKAVEDALGGVLKPVEKWVERDQTKESREKYGGCRMKGTCSK